MLDMIVFKITVSFIARHRSFGVASLSLIYICIHLFVFWFVTWSFPMLDFLWTCWHVVGDCWAVYLTTCCWGAPIPCFFYGCQGGYYMILTAMLRGCAERYWLLLECLSVQRVRILFYLLCRCDFQWENLQWDIKMWKLHQLSKVIFD